MKLEHGAYNVLQSLYLDWLNNFLTVSAFAAYYNMSERAARIVIEAGREEHERIAKILRIDA